MASSSISSVLDSSTRRIRIKIIAHNETEQNAKNIAEKLKGHYDVSVLDVQNIGSEDANDADYWFILTTDETPWTRIAETNFAKLGIPRNARGLAIYQSSACKLTRKHVAFPMIKVENNSKKMAREVMIFIEAQELAESNKLQMDGIHIYAALLIRSLYYPQEKMMDWKSYVNLSSSFNEAYGGFKNLNIGPMTKFLEKGNFLFKHNEEKCKISATLNNEICLVVDKVNLNFNIAHDIQTQSLEPGDIPSQPTYSTAIPDKIYQTEISSKIKKMLVEIHSGHAMFLITNVPHSYGDLQGITNIPWVRVFDFDTESRSSGLLSDLESTIKKKSNFTISTPFDPVKKLSQLSTDWMFINGFDDKPETIIDGSVAKWLSRHKKFNTNLHSTQTEFCWGKHMPIFLVLWYKSTRFDDKLLERFLADASAEFSPKNDNLQLEIILCIPSDSECKESMKDLIEELDLTDNTYQLPFSEAVSWLSDIKVSSSILHQVMLPRRSDKDGDKEKVAIIPEDLAWVGSQIELVSTNSEKYKREVKNPGLEFVKGGQITWEEIKMETIAIHRVTEMDMYKNITDGYIKEFKSGIIQVNHSPGGGGSTFAKQILWYLQKKVPCGVLLPKVSFEYDEIKDCLEFLYEKTLLPFVLLVDGGSRSEIDILFAEKPCPLIVLHVQRKYSTKQVESQYEPGKCNLSGIVTSREAKHLQNLFSSFAPKSQKGLLQLYNDVAVEKIPRQIFEFGLMAFDHEYKGVGRFVQGNMEFIEKVKQSQQIKDILTYLSLLMYFGQSGIPSQTFHSLLPGTKRFITLDTIPMAECFIVEEEGTWKICHNAVALYILIYTIGGSFHKNPSDTLPIHVKQRIHEPVINLIKLIGSVCKNNNIDEFVYPLVSTILKRKYEDVSITDSIKEFKKSEMSRLLECVSKEHKLAILQELTNAFPNHAEFHAHLGRYLAMDEQFEEAEKQLETAVEIGTAEVAGTNSRRNNNVLGRIYDMFGCSRTREIKHLINDTSNISIDDLIHKILPVTQHAIKCFKQARKFVSQNRNYSYMGEIRVRLDVVDCFYTNFGNEVHKQPRLNKFVRESHGECDNLLIECDYELPARELKLKSVKGMYNWYLTRFFEIFTRYNQESIDTTDLPTVEKNRFKIAIIKNKNGEISVNKLNNVDDVKKIIKLNEEIVREVFLTNNTHVSISKSILEWLDAIRHHQTEDEYTISNVLLMMEDWYRVQGSANFSYSLFYVFIMYFLRVITFPAGKLLTGYIRKLKETMSLVIKTYKRTGFKKDLIEFYALHNKTTIRKLISKKEVEPWDDETNLFQKSEKLQVCTGTVFQSSNPVNGLISFKIQQDTIKLYFTPKRCHLYGRRFEQQSTPVEFFVGFGLARGAEAVSVKQLHKRHCSRCKTDQLIITLNEMPGKGRCFTCHFPVTLPRP